MTGFATTRASVPALLGLVLILGGVLRLVSLAEQPPGLYVDEVGLGTNARLIAEGGIDQYGRGFPVFFRMFDDYKCGLYVYSLAPLYVMFPPSDFLVRLPAALWGLGAVAAAFFLAREVYRDSAVALWAALFVAVSPWHVHYSRAAWQAVLLPTLFAISVGLLLRWCRTGKRSTAAWAGLVCGLSLYSYTTAKLLLAVTVAVTLFWQRRRGRSASRSGVWVFASTLTLAALPFTLAYLLQLESINLRFGHLMVPLSEMPWAYLSHLDPRYLFWYGDALPRHSTGTAPEPLYLAPLLLLGVIDALRRPATARSVPVLALFVVPVLGTFSEGYPHATRTLVFVPFVQVLAAGGLDRLRAWLDSRIARAVLPVVLSLAVALSTAHFLHVYFGEYRRHNLDAWFAGLLPALRVAEQHRRPDELVHMMTTSGHYAFWMYVACTPADEIRRHRATIDVHRDFYDPLDTRGKYAFLPYRVVQPGQIGPQVATGLWVAHAAEFPPARLRRLKSRGVIEELFKNARFVVFRFTGRRANGSPRSPIRGPSPSTR